MNRDVYTVEKWIERFRVRSFALTARSELSILTFCDYLQEAASNHADTLGLSKKALEEDGLMWVLSRMHIAVARSPAWNEKIEVVTWPSGENGLFAYREFIVYDAAHLEIARATSQWLV